MRLACTGTADNTVQRGAATTYCCPKKSRTRHMGVLREILIIPRSSNPFVRQAHPHMWFVQYFGGFPTLTDRLFTLIACQVSGTTLKMLRSVRGLGAFQVTASPYCSHPLAGAAWASVGLCEPFYFYSSFFFYSYRGHRLAQLCL